MNNILITILNMSLTGVFVITVICAARFALKKFPKIISYCLWGVVGFRLVFPFSIESAWSLIPFNAQIISSDMAMSQALQGVPLVGGAVYGDPVQLWITIGLSVWLLGVAVMLLYGVLSYVILRRKLKGAVHAGTNIYEAQMIKTPFVFGIFSPKIFLPDNLTAGERKYIVLHEQTHIKRRDHVIKCAAYLILCVHWFNPLVWLAFVLMSMDMEMSCDESVLKELGGEPKREYSMVLLSLASERRVINGGIPAFGDGNIKARISNVLRLKKQSRAVSCVLMALVVALSLGLAVNSIAVGYISSEFGQYDDAGGMPTDASDFVFERWQCCD